MTYFLRFPIDIEVDMTRKTSLDWIADSREAAGISENATHDKNGRLLIDEDHGVCVILPGLCAHELQAETLEEAIEEAQTTSWPYGDVRSNDWVIIDGEYIEDLPFGDGVLMTPKEVVYQSPAAGQE